MNRQIIESIIAKSIFEFPHMHGTIIIAKDDEVLWHEGFSYIDAPFPTDKNAQYLISSLTKTFTAVAVLKMLFDKHVQMGVSKNNKAVLLSNILEDLRKPLSCFSLSKLWSPPPQWTHRVNLHHLLTHTSGISNYPESLAFEPGEKYAYSNAGYLLLGRIIEEFTSQSIDSYLHQMLFAPAQMFSTFLPLSGNPKTLKDTTTHKALSLGFEKKQEDYQSVSESRSFENLLTSGGIISTAYDLIKWNHSLFKGEIIPSFLIDLITTPYVNKEGYLFYDGFEDLEYGYGLDIANQENYKIYQHCGGTKGYQSKISYDPYTHISVVNLSNIDEESPSAFTFSNVLRDLLKNNDMDLETTKN
jgi:D-alanyl-D-alanine carboxypeptidase